MLYRTKPDIKLEMMEFSTTTFSKISCIGLRLPIVLWTPEQKFKENVGFENNWVFYRMETGNTQSGESTY